jgi:hypothetical protein
MPSVTVGITNRISITGGSTLIPNAQSQVAYIAPKITAWQQSGVHLAAGLMYFKAISNNDGVGVVYGMGTFEKAPFAGMTIGVGWGAGSGELESSGIMFLGGELRLLDGLKLISENWFLLGKGNSVLSIGARFFGQHLAVDVAGYLPLDSGLGENGVPFLPWLGLAYTFGG